MTTITLPPEIEETVAQQAQRQGTTTELLALDVLRRSFAPPPEAEKADMGDTLYDFLRGYIGTVNGSSEAFSEDCGEKFAEGMAQKQQEGRL